MTLDQRLSSPLPLSDTAPSTGPVPSRGPVQSSGPLLSSNGLLLSNAGDEQRVTIPVAVLVPTHRRKAHLEMALRSIANQRGVRPCEVIVVDDASHDGTADLARSWGATVIEKETNEGPGAARADGSTAAASAEWVAMLDDDDEWLPNHLSTLWENRHGHVMVAGTSVDIGHGPPRAHGAPTIKAEVVRSPGRLFFPENSFTTSATMVRCDALSRAGGFDPEVRHAEDLDAWLRVLEHGTGLLLPQVTCFYRVHGAQTSRDRGSMTGSCSVLMEKYADRPWMTESLREQAQTVTAWDDFQAARAEGDKAGMIRAAAWLGRRPSSVVNLPRLWAYRRQVRQKGWAEAQKLGLLAADRSSADQDKAAAD